MHIGSTVVGASHAHCGATHCCWDRYHDPRTLGDRTVGRAFFVVGPLSVKTLLPSYSSSSDSWTWVAAAGVPPRRPFPWVARGMLN